MEQKTDYDAFAPFYDTVMGDPIERVSLIKNSLEKYSPDAKSVLELACGTGNILIGLGDRYERVGLDKSKGMLDIARCKAPTIQFLEGDMRDFEIGRRFDVILCVFDSVNHLTQFSDWEKLFQNVKRHLNSGGIFMFDINTLAKLKRLANSPSFEQQFDRKRALITVTEDRENIYNWQVVIFETAEDGQEIAYEENIREASFDKSDIEDALSKYFKIKGVIETEQREPDLEPGRLYFIVQKQNKLSRRA